VNNEVTPRSLYRYVNVDVAAKPQLTFEETEQALRHLLMSVGHWATAARLGGRNAILHCGIYAGEIKMLLENNTSLAGMYKDDIHELNIVLNDVVTAGDDEI
jgi:hypothetical protein